jgi:hypothetical protein
VVEILPDRPFEIRRQVTLKWLSFSLGEPLQYLHSLLEKLTTDIHQNVSGLAWHTDDTTLRTKFEEFGQVEEAVSSTNETPLVIERV